MESIEMNDSNIIREPHRGSIVISRLVVLALLSLMLWLSAVAAVSAQSMSSTSPCTPGINNAGNALPPSGWQLLMTPDCSTLANWGGPLGPAFGQGPAPALGPVPATPSGATTFWTLYSRRSTPTNQEGLSTTITSLQAGMSYNVTVYFNNNYIVGDRRYQSCPSAEIVINGTSNFISLTPASNTWSPRTVSFVATGTTATFVVRNIVPASEGCIVNVYIPGLTPPPTDVQVVKTVSPTGAVASGSVLTYTLTARNNGPEATTNVALSDQPSAGLNCATPSTTATCSASGGASCPGATVPASSLFGPGIRIPNLPVGGQVVVTMRCTVTATGR